MHVDLPLTELLDYLPDIDEPADFDTFWADQLAAAASFDLDPQADPHPCPVPSVQAFDVSFRGHGGSLIRAWALVPREAASDRPAVVEFVGYGGGRGDILEWMSWSCLGYPHLVMDARGQGGGWRAADTPDPGDRGEPGARGFLTQGIGHPAEHYFTRLFVDAARAVAVVTELPAFAGRRIVTTGGSQGGGLALAAAQLDRRVSACAPDVPFLAHPRRATEVTDAHPYAEIAEYCRVHPQRVDDVFATLSYLDVVTHARRITVPGLFSVGLADLITPPSTVFAAYNHYAGPKDIGIYHYNGHEGGGVTHLRRKLDFLAGLVR